ncbi:LOG family protein, partial [Staphylococcus haemolyticus]|uniref:LOG family protein n=1 Tax=Staphylococcus haemolyticus TaxID=1283 RepID=UPI0021B4C2CD
MDEGKEKMGEVGDGFVMGGGGGGCVEEFLESYSWGEIGIDEKGIGVYNLNGLFNRVEEVINSMIEEGC